MKEQKKEILSNWHSEREESAYLYYSEYPKYEYTEFKWRFVEPNELKELNENGLNEKKYKGEFLMCLELWDLHLLDELRVSFLFRPIEYINNGNERAIEFRELINLESSLFNEEEPIKIYVSYPLSSLIELTIFPVKMEKSSGEIYKISSLGYIAWQVSKLYGIIFKSYSEESGVWGHSLSDLQLSSIRIFDKNIMNLGVSS